MDETKPKRKSIVFGLAKGEEKLTTSLVSYKSTALKKSIVNILNGEEGSIERLAFDTDPTQHTTLAGVYQPKTKGVPDDILKRIAVQDSLVSNIVRARQNHISVFGRPRPDRFSTGFVIEPNTGVLDSLSREEKAELDVQIERAAFMLKNCGNTSGMEDEDKITLVECMMLLTRNAIVNGRIALEIIYTGEGDGKKFHHFAPIDASTIYKAAEKNQSAQQGVRDQAWATLQSITGKKLKKERYDNNDYKWIQVFAGRALGAFTGEEVKCYNFYPVPDIEWNGYPVTPIDTVITSITTHINIVNHNRLYFQSGRATRGMLVISSDDDNPQVIHNIKQQFNASINNVNNSWRMPVFGCGIGETITWQPIDSGGQKDAEFQYLTDMNAREILTAFMMSPDELPGWSYLSRGTSNQALSESNNEYKLNAARDVGIRPLLQGLEDFFNSNVMPLIDFNLSKKVRLRFMGLDADNAEKEAVRLQQDSSIWETYDGLMRRVEKKPIGKMWGGELPFNQVIKSYIDQYFTVGEILEHFCGIEGASKDPALAYRRDPMFFQWAQMQQAQQQQQQMLQAQQQQAQQQGQGGDAQPTQDDQKQPTEKQKDAQVEESSASGGAGGDELARSIDMALDSLTKSEKDLPPNKRRILTQHKKTIDFFMNGWEEDAKQAVAEVMKVAKHHIKK